MIISPLFAILLLTVFCRQSESIYRIPYVQIEAFSPKGFKASIPDVKGLKFFAFHGKINEKISPNSVGHFHQDIVKPTKGFWIYEEPNLQLHVGDVVNYWVFVQHESSRYQKDNLSFTITELINKETQLTCELSETTLNGNKQCKGKVIVDEKFDSIDENKWTICKYIPTLSENYEFNYYSPESVRVKESNLVIKPRIVSDESHLRGVLNLTQGCTSSEGEECVYEQKGAFYLPPVISGCLKSKFTFKFSKIDILCKLPCGDWIYPVIRLVPKDKSENSSIYLIYSRGNEYLRANDGTDIGGKLLLSGPSFNSSEPSRSRFFASTFKYEEPFCKREHLYSMKWTSDEILFYVDGKQYGEIRNSESLDQFSKDNLEYELHIGVGIGGIYEFPNDFTSTGGYKKPWVNKDVKQIKDFYTSRNLWLQTWSDSSTYLSVNSIKIYAI